MTPDSTTRMDDHRLYAERWRAHLDKSGVMETEFLFPKLKEYLGSLTGQTVLDAGCGGGWTTPLLQEAGAEQIFAADFNIFLLRDAIQKLGLGINFVCADLRRMPAKDGTFETILCKGIFMNQDDPSVIQTLNELRRIAAHGCKMVGMIVHPDWHFIVNQGKNFNNPADRDSYKTNERLSLDSLPGITDYDRYRRPLEWYQKTFGETGWKVDFEDVIIDRTFEGMPDRYRQRVGHPPIFAVFNAKKA